MVHVETDAVAEQEPDAWPNDPMLSVWVTLLSLQLPLSMRAELASDQAGWPADLDGTSVAFFEGLWEFASALLAVPGAV